MITYVQRGDILDYTPETDTPAGTPVKIGDIVGITKLDIKAGQLGAIALTGVYEAPKPEGEEIAAGAAVAYDPATGAVSAVQAVTGGDTGGDGGDAGGDPAPEPAAEKIPVGIAVAAAGASDLTVRFLLGF
jgi:predicted RecA/RadA family phage recombinase